VNTTRLFLSTTALAAFSLLAAGSSPDLAEELAELGELSEQPASAPIDSSDFTLEDLRGRQIWAIDADPSYCAKLEQLGLIVECDPNWGSGNTEQIVIRCTEIPHAAAPMILDYLGLNHFTVDTYVTDPSSANDGECGDVYEIAIWFGPNY
jgi:hypothetical protein